MKENKFLFYGCVVIAFVCAMLLLFRVSHDVKFTYEPTEESLETADLNEFFVDDSEKSTTADDFIECSSRFKSQVWISDTDNETVERYRAANTVTCKCEFDGAIVERTKMYQYSSEQDAAELDCNNKCVEICAE